MEATRFSELTPRSVWDIVDDAFDLYRERFVLLLGSASLIYVPVYIVRLLLLAGPYARFYKETAGRATNDPMAIFGASSGLFGFSILTMPLLLIAAALFSAVSAVIVTDSLNGQRITKVVEAYRPIKARFGVILGGALCSILATAAGYILCVLPAIYIALMLSFVPQILALEGKGVSAAFKRSQDMIRPDFFRVFSLLLLLSAITVLLEGGIEGLLSAVYLLIPGGTESPMLQTQHTMLQETLSSLVALLLAPLSSIALTLLYLDFRVRREGLDITARAEESSVSLAPDPFGEMPSDEARKRSQRIQRNRR